MRYFVKGVEIRSENAAKPPSAASKWLLNWIRCLPAEADGLDLGCGKLRYTIPLAKRIGSVTAVDSRVQLDRKQRIGSKISSVRSYAKRYLANVRICCSDDAEWRTCRFDVILCSNVLSAIPDYRTRVRLLQAAYNCLRSDGLFLLTTQFKNSHFSAWKSAPNAKKFLDGYLVRGRKGTSFYGLLNADSLTNLCRTAGFDIVESGHVKETAFVLARRAKRPRKFICKSLSINLAFPIKESCAGWIRRE